MQPPDLDESIHFCLGLSSSCYTQGAICRKAGSLAQPITTAAVFQVFVDTCFACQMMLAYCLEHGSLAGWHLQVSLHCEVGRRADGAGWVAALGHWHTR